MPRHGCESGWHNSLYNNIHPCRLQESDVSRGSPARVGAPPTLAAAARSVACACSSAAPPCACAPLSKPDVQ